MKVTSTAGGCLAAALLLMCSFCSPRAENAPVVAAANYSVEQYFNERDATVVLLNYDTMQPACSAVSVYDRDGSAVLATAAHCVLRKVDRFDPSPDAEREAKIGDEVLYVMRNDWMYPVSTTDRAKVKLFDMDRDQAVLAVDQFKVPTPLFKSKYCDFCTFDDYQVHAVSAVYHWDRHTGYITRRSYSGVGSYFFESSLTIDYGWSGSPVINSQGEVMGIITRCSPGKDPDDPDMPMCKPGWSMFTSLPW